LIFLLWLRFTGAVTRRSHDLSAWSNALELSSLWIGSMILVAVVDWLLPLDLRVLGILPRTVRGVPGILFSPLLHEGFAHLAANLVPLFILLVLLFAQRLYSPARTLTFIWLGSGFGTWLIGRGGYIHIGASSLIYGLVTYLVAAGFWVRHWRAVVVALAVLLLYGGIFYGVLPQQGRVSWEGHLAGAVTGFLVARATHSKG
jgi:membrane associated rhomboid family serine protease